MSKNNEASEFRKKAKMQMTLRVTRDVELDYYAGEDLPE